MYCTGLAGVLVNTDSTLHIHFNICSSPYILTSITLVTLCVILPQTLLPCSSVCMAIYGSYNSCFDNTTHYDNYVGSQ